MCFVIFDNLYILYSSGTLKTYIVLCEQYESSLVRDPNYTEYLDKIGQLFFNVKPIERRPRSPDGFLGNFYNCYMNYVDGYSITLYCHHLLIILYE